MYWASKKFHGNRELTKKYCIQNGKKKNVKQHIHEPWTKKSLLGLKVLSLSALVFRDSGMRCLWDLQLFLMKNKLFL